MEVCVTPLPEVKTMTEVAGGQLEPFPQRLNAVPPRITHGFVPGFSVQSYQDDNKLWQKHINAYKKINNLLDTGRYRNIMDMNAGLGSFAAALESTKLWVMNVVPTIADTSTLGVIYERGLIGMYHDWYVMLLCIALLDSCFGHCTLFFSLIQLFFVPLFLHTIFCFLEETHFTLPTWKTFFFNGFHLLQKHVKNGSIYLLL